MGFLDAVVEFAKGYEKGKAWAQTMELLSKQGAAAISEIYHLVTTSSDDQLDRIEGFLAHATEHALTRGLRAHAAEILGCFRDIRG
jgi:hypothetical protein